jgi:rhamnosyltransferase
MSCCSSRHTLGFKAIFSSNSFSAYRKAALLDVGGFPSDVIVSEETVVFARMLQRGWKTAYVAEAIAKHSHDYTLMQEFQRYFDIGVLHTKERWLLETYGRVQGEGRRFVLSEWRHILPKHFYLLPSSVVRNLFKIVAYHLGRKYQFIPKGLLSSLSQQKNFWKTA